MGTCTNCAPLVADIFLCCYENDFIDSLNHDNQADVIEAINSISRYLNDLLNIDSFILKACSIKFIHLNYTTDTEVPFKHLHHSIAANEFVSSKFYDKHD